MFVYLDVFACCFDEFLMERGWMQNAGNFLHGGATASLVDMVGSAAIYSVGAPTSGVSVEINVSYLDAAFAEVIVLYACDDPSNCNDDGCTFFYPSTFCTFLPVTF